MDYRKRMIVKPGQMLRLKDVDPAFKGRHETREAAARRNWSDTGKSSFNYKVCCMPRKSIPF